MHTPKFLSWSQTRLADYDQCPLFAKLKHLDKLCPLCFKGRIRGGYDSPAMCDTCDEMIVKSDALTRGIEIGKALEEFVNGKRRKMHDEVRHPNILRLARELREGFTKSKVAVERMINLDKDWNLLPAAWSPRVWLIVKMDVFLQKSSKTGRVIDWKTGGLEKRGPTAGKPREDSKKYAEQLQIYSTAALCAFPQMETMTAALAFVDANAKYNPVIEMKEGSITRTALEKNKKALAKRALPMFTDDTFAPRANERCKWCDYQKGKGGPCPY